MPVKECHLVVYDYGMGGIWLQIWAESGAEIERRWPALKVVQPGNPEWLTQERFAEDRGWAREMEFDIDCPTGFLVDADDELRKPNPPA
jgi:hypothetical protein